jgi:hypothetical protein
LTSYGKAVSDAILTLKPVTHAPGTFSPNLQRFYCRYNCLLETIKGGQENDWQEDFFHEGRAHYNAYGKPGGRKCMQKKNRL